ncbi:Cation transport ATPase [Nostoc flagelliforme CCNUN1]|uniref:Cation transport ATPase n=2 Tax=Nostoc flagelliforme TaxID=1306274 RepID=A0A2K8T005_9NOSO|nr:Cation transport ATPase [Nostoc flagelliforme CCNUN1]
MELKNSTMTSIKRSNSDKAASLNLRLPPKKAAKNVANKTAPSQKIFYSIVHTIPGRIRFRIPLLARDTEYANQLKLAIESDTRVTNVRANPKAASIVINYKVGVISDNQMREHLVNLIQTAQDVVVPKEVMAKSIVGTIFDALINLIDSTRKLNQARNVIVYRRVRTDVWERILSTSRSVIKRLKSATMFILPNKRWRLRGNGGMNSQPLKLKSASEPELV